MCMTNGEALRRKQVLPLQCIYEDDLITVFVGKERIVIQHKMDDEIERSGGTWTLAAVEVKPDASGLHLWLNGQIEQRPCSMILRNKRTA